MHKPPMAIGENVFCFDERGWLIMYDMVRKYVENIGSTSQRRLQMLHGGATRRNLQFLLSQRQ